MPVTLSDPLKAYRPTRTRPFDHAAASRFLRRVTFAPTGREIDDAVKKGPAALARELVQGTSESEAYRELDPIGERLAEREPQKIETLRGWWLRRLVTTARPFHARLHLFWHDHFATSFAKVQDARLLLRQLRTIERLALGSFPEMLLEISRDPAMILWLDGDQNEKGRPNENYARELFELFSLGVGNYTEHDIREAARAFTGWHQKDGRFRFVARSHDGGRKTVLGTTGALGGEDVVAIAAKQPACATFLARKLLADLLAPDPAAEIVDALAARLRKNDLHVGRTLEALLASDVMHDPRFARSRVRSPVEIVLGLVRSLEIRGAPAQVLADATTQMGQRLFEPPSVEGWEHHRGWLNSATMLVRLNAAVAAVDGNGVDFDPKRLRKAYRLRDAADVFAFAEGLALDGDVPLDLAARVRALGGGIDRQLREALRLLLTSPEYQLA